VVAELGLWIMYGGLLMSTENWPKMDYFDANLTFRPFSVLAISKQVGAVNAEGD
jgi:hypothetical protein